VSGVPVSVLQDIQLATGGFTGASQVIWSASGTLAYVPDVLSQESGLAWIDRSGREERIALPNNHYSGQSRQIQVSPDGSRVAMTITNDTASRQGRSGTDIWVWEIARGTLTRLTFNSRSTSPVWTPDSTRVCSASDTGFFCQAADGTGQRQPMFEGANSLVLNTALGTVSPDGRAMLLTIRGTARNLDIVIAPMGSRAEVRPLVQSPGDDFAPAISPDGRWLTYVSSESGRNEIYVRPFPDVDSGRWQISNGGGVDPVWSPKGGELFYRGSSGSAGSTVASTELMSVAYQASPGFRPGNPTLLLNLPSGAGRGFAVGHDGRFLFNIPVSSVDNPVGREQIVIVQNWFDELKARVAATK
jgi:Tol biopolymer transport system component